MASTRNIVVRVLEEHGQFVSPGILYCDAKLDGYEGTQERLLKIANEMVREKQIIGRRRGMTQKVWYKLKEKSLEGAYHG
jgi:hypothetical protein